MLRFLLSAEPLDVAALGAGLRDPRAGGFATFEGWVRDHHAGRAVDGGEFSDFIFVTDDDGAVFTFEFQVLRRFSDDGVREDVIVFAHAHVFRNDGMGFDDAAFSDFTPWADDGVRSDFHVVMQDCRRVDDGRRMNVRI